MLTRQAFSFFCSCICFASYGQEISGTWEGRFNGLNNNDNFRGDRTTPFVVELNVHQDSLVTGTTFSGDINGRHKYYAVSGVYNKRDSTIFFKQDSAISINRGGGVDNIGYYRLKLRIENNNMMVFEGKWKPNDGGFGTSKLSLKKRIPSKAQQESVKKPTLPDRNLERSETVLARIEIDFAEKDSIRLELLDNNRIDNDIVSVYMDDSLVLKSHALTSTPHLLFLSLDHKSAICRIKIAAESVGAEPPCTAIMIVSTKTSRRLVDLSSTFTENAAMDIVLKEK